MNNNNNIESSNSWEDIKKEFVCNSRTSLKVGFNIYRYVWVVIVPFIYVSYSDILNNKENWPTDINMHNASVRNKNNIDLCVTIISDSQFEMWDNYDSSMHIDINTFVCKIENCSAF